MVQAPPAPGAALTSPSEPALEPPPSGRAARRERRHADILDAAFDVFAAHGFAGARLEDVAERVGITKGAIYSYFPGKADLFVAVVRGTTEPIFAEIARLAERTDLDPRAALRLTLEMVYRGFVENRRAREAMRLLIAETARFPDLADQYHSSVSKRGDELARIIERGIAGGVFRRDAPTGPLAQLLVAPAVMASIILLIDGEAKLPAIRVWQEAHIDLVLRGLAA